MPNPWIPTSNPLDLKVLGKLGEELGECSAAVSRCIIQQITEKEPVTGKPNVHWLEEEIADVLANAHLVIQHFKLDTDFIQQRVERKQTYLRQWHQMKV